MESGEANLVVTVDTSGSIPREALEDFLEEVDARKGQIRASIALLLCDSALAPGMPLRFFPREPITIMSIIALMIHSAVDFNLQIPANALTFMFILALAWLSGQRQGAEAGRRLAVTATRSAVRSWRTRRCA